MKFDESDDQGNMKPLPQIIDELWMKLEREKRKNGGSGSTLRDVQTFLLERCALLEEVGIASDRIIIDPGFGFGKSLEHNYQLLAQFALFAEHGYPVLAGISRKSMLGKVTQQEVSDRLVPSIAAAIMAVERGAKIVRTHDVRETMDALRVWQAMREQELTSFIMNND